MGSKLMSQAAASVSEVGPEVKICDGCRAGTGGAGAGTPHLMGATAVAVLEVWEIPGNPGDSPLLCKMS